MPYTILKLAPLGTLHEPEGPLDVLPSFLRWGRCQSSAHHGSGRGSDLVPPQSPPHPEGPGPEFPSQHMTESVSCRESSGRSFVKWCPQPGPCVCRQAHLRFPLSVRLFQKSGQFMKSWQVLQGTWLCTWISTEQINPIPACRPALCGLIGQCEKKWYKDQLLNYANPERAAQRGGWGHPGQVWGLAGTGQEPDLWPSVLPKCLEDPLWELSQFRCLLTVPHVLPRCGSTGGILCNHFLWLAGTMCVRS